MFHISLISDERVEHITSISINTHLNIPHMEILETLEGAFYQKEPEEILPIPPCKGLNHIISLVQKEVEKVAKGHQKDLEKRLERFKKEELEKINTFYQEKKRELQEKIGRLDETFQNEKKKENLLLKLKSNQIDKERRITDIQEKFSIKIQIKQSDLLHYRFPKMRIHLTLQKHQSTFPS